MKKWLIYLLIPVMLLQSNSTLLICTSFYYNQNYIEKYLCIQRNMENNNCHGQCYLAKKLKAQQEHEQENFKVNLQESISMFELVFSLQRPISAEIDEQPYNLFASNLHPKLLVGGLFRPPLV
ncbi:hypothetical protein [Sphingobacterium sp. CZ-2]|uniref:hypothetical protein n=1 Tax=Sphingobacterium sp. CZ-2 TaxID=2557994 RepID=UPI00106F409B|nr:hypothetical protein [Sphingobacterium sp. CZ-2]QBR13045.1 hypothetical protein E3D81_13065 [Sphingobacterium sp. CZ-2]